MSKVSKTISFDFEHELLAVRRRVARLEAAIAGTATITEVKVKACAVRAHKREAYSRYVITLRRR